MRNEEKVSGEFTLLWKGEGKGRHMRKKEDGNVGKVEEERGNERGRESAGLRGQEEGKEDTSVSVTTDDLFDRNRY